MAHGWKARTVEAPDKRLVPREVLLFVKLVQNVHLGGYR